MAGISRIYFVIIFAFSLFSALEATAKSYARPSDNPEQNELFRKFSALTSDTLMKMGRKYYSHYAPDSALTCFSIISGRYGERMDIREKDLTARALVNAGCVYGFFYFDYNLSYQSFRKALDICEKEPRLKEAKAIAYLNLAALLDGNIRRTKETGRSNAIKKLYEEVVKTAIESRNWEMLAMVFFTLAEYDYDFDLSRFNIILDQTIPDTVPGIRFCRLLYRGLENINANRPAQARQFFMRQLDSRLSTHNPERMRLSAYVNIARTYQIEKDFSTALSYTDSAYSVATEYNSEDYLLFLKRMKSRICREAGLPEDARKWEMAYLKSRDSLQTLHSSPTVEELNLVYEVRQGEEKIKLATVRNRYMTWIIVLFAAILVIILTAFILLKRKNRDLNQRLRDLYQRNNELMRTREDLSALLKDCDECQLKQHEETRTSDSKGKYTKSMLSDDEKRRLYAVIDRTMNDPAVICNPEFSLSQLVHIAGSNTTYVSQVINEKYHVSFSILLGNSRVREGCRRIQNGDADIRNITLETFSHDLGFKSRTTFVTAFKRVMAMTPSEYITLSYSKQ